MIRKLASLVLAGALGLGLAATAAADDPPASRRGVIDLPVTYIQGRAEVPVQFVLVRTESGYRVVEQRPDLVREIVRSTRAGAF